MERLFLHEEISAYKTFADPIEIPEIISKGLSPKIVLREYQEEAFRNFIINFNLLSILCNVRQSISSSRARVIRINLWPCSSSRAFNVRRS